MSFIEASLSDLNGSDGSATSKQNGYGVIGAVNGLLEVQRKDELPDQAAIEVNLRPAAGIGSPKERHLEKIILSALRHVVLVQMFPRTLIQLTLQILSTPDEDTSLDRSLPSASYLPILPTLLQTAMLTLLSGSIPMATTFTSLLLAITSSGEIIISPSLRAIAQSTSTHVFSFTTDGDLLVAESEGEFEMGQWERANDLAKEMCCRKGVVPDAPMDTDLENLQDVLRTVMQQKVQKEQRWKEAH